MNNIKFGIKNLYLKETFDSSMETILRKASTSDIKNILTARRYPTVNIKIKPLILLIDHMLYFVVPIKILDNQNVVVRLLSNLLTTKPNEFWNNTIIKTKYDLLDISSSYPFSNVIPKQTIMSRNSDSLKGLLEIDNNSLYYFNKDDIPGPLSYFNNQIMTNLYNIKPDNELKNNELETLLGITKQGHSYNKYIYEWYQIINDLS